MEFSSRMRNEKRLFYFNRVAHPSQEVKKTKRKKAPRFGAVKQLFFLNIYSDDQYCFPKANLRSSVRKEKSPSPQTPYSKKAFHTRPGLKGMLNLANSRWTRDRMPIEVMRGRRPIRIRQLAYPIGSTSPVPVSDPRAIE